MQGIFGTLLSTQMFYEQTNSIFESCFSNPTNQKLLSVLYGHRQVIQKLLENQNVLKAGFQGPQRLETTDTEHSRNQSDDNNLLQSREKPEGLLKKINTILIKQEKQYVTIQNKAQRRGIQLVCSCPIQENYITEQLQQKKELKQHQKHPEQTKKCCETKNIIKNYGKSILMFLRRNRALAKKILDLYEFDEKQFYEEFQKFRDRVNSITELKLFWTQKGNKFAKVYRIISSIYLKKFSLKHTFSSRVKNYGVHIKYRKRLLDVLKNPEDFSSIKYI